MLSRRGEDHSDPLRGQGVEHLELRRSGRAGHVAFGTLACPACDAPVMPGGPVAPRDVLGCPFCGHAAPTRDFLSLGEPTRPARVAVRVVSLRP